MNMKSLLKIKNGKERGITGQALKDRSELLGRLSPFTFHVFHDAPV